MAQIQIPSYLLEGDEPTLPPESQLPKKPKPAVVVPKELPVPEGLPLPTHYGTGALYLAARDPRCLFAQWDLAPDEQRRLNSLSADGHLVLRLSFSGTGALPLAEAHVHPESRHWFLQVPQPGAAYLAELGIYRPGSIWCSVATSSPVETPRESLAEDRSAIFGTAPPRQAAPAQTAAFQGEVPGGPEEVRPAPVPPPWPVRPFVQLPFPEAPGGLLEIQAPPPESGVEWAPMPLPPAPPYWGTPPPRSEERRPSQVETASWTEEQEHLLYELVGAEVVWQNRGGSAEIAELVKKFGAAPQLPQGMELISSPMGPGQAEAGAPTSPSEAPAQGAPASFWFNVNAELIVYGATEPDALVEMGGRRIRLRSDGTFSYRFALPDGNYELPISAESARTDDRRLVRLQFARATEYRGEVGAHSQDPNLKTAAPENVQ